MRDYVKLIYIQIFKKKKEDLNTTTNNIKVVTVYDCLYLFFSPQFKVFFFQCHMMFLHEAE